MTKTIITFALIFIHTYAQAQENVLWKFKTNDRIYASALIVDDILFFGSGDHSIYAIDKNTGTKIWEYKTYQIEIYETEFYMTGVNQPLRYVKYAKKEDTKERSQILTITTCF